MKHKDDGKFVVVQGAQRISDLQPDEQTALAEAAKSRELVEASGQNGKQEAKKITVKQNLLG